MQYQVNDQRIYLDHAATTPISEIARDAIMRHLCEPYANPSSIHSAGRHAFDTLTELRAQIAHTLETKTTELIITGSGTESDNLAILGLARAHRTFGNHIIVSAIEHKAVLAAANQLEKEGFRVTYLPVSPSGLVDLEDLAAAICPQTILVSIMYANNEIGTIEPISEVVRICRAHNAVSCYPLVHTDACQAVGLLPVLPTVLGVDAMTINSAKIYGPKGVGLLYLREGVAIESCVVGGSQEYGRRAGTENIAFIAGFAAALTEAVEKTKVHAKRMRALQAVFIESLKRQVPKLQLNGHPTKRLPNNVHVTVPEVEGESLVLMLSEAGICCATGSACSSHELEPSHVLQAIGQDLDHIHGSIRFSLGVATTESELLQTADTFAHIVTQLRTITASTTTVYQSHIKTYATHT